VEEEKRVSSHEVRYEKRTITEDGREKTEVSRNFESRSHTFKLEQRSAVTVRKIIQATSVRTSTFRRDYMSSVLSCDVNNVHSLVVLEAYMKTIAPKLPAIEPAPEIPADPSLTPQEQRVKNRVYFYEYMRLQDFNRLRHMEKHRVIAQLERDKDTCVQGLSGKPKVSLECLCRSGNPFALHLRDLRDAQDDCERRFLSPTFMQAVDSAAPPRLLTANDNAQQIDRVLRGLRASRSTGYTPDSTLPYTSDRLVVPVEAFAPPLSAKTLALLVRTMLISHTDVTTNLTVLVRERLHANGLMTVDELTGVMQSFAEALLLEAQVPHPDMEVMYLMWENAERLFFDTVHFLETYAPIADPHSVDILGVTARRPATSPITDHMTAILPGWRTLPALAEFALVGKTVLPPCERSIMFVVPCNGDSLEDRERGVFDDGRSYYMKDMPLRVQFGKF
jgi:hypothetical protein